MPAKTKATRRRIELSLHRACEEFGVSRDSLRKALLSADHEIAAGIEFTIQEVYDALSGGGQYRASKAREAAARAALLEFKAQRLKGEIVEVAEAINFVESSLRHVRELLDAMPARMAAQVNPENPDYAFSQLRQWVASAIQDMRKAHRGKGEIEPGRSQSKHSVDDYDLG